MAPDEPQEDAKKDQTHARCDTIIAQRRVDSEIPAEALAALAGPLGAIVGHAWNPK